MPYLIINNFAAGLDTRRHPMVAPAGSLQKCVNAAITRGGEIAKRRAYVPVYQLPAGTKNLATVQHGIYVFGSDAEPAGMPIGVNYQRLEHPGGVALHRVLSWDVFDRKIYAVAEFSDGSIFHYYDGVRVTDWYDGRARCSFTLTGGAPGDSIDSIKVDGIEVLGVPVPWVDSDVDTAQAVVDQVNLFVSAPNYDASRSGNTINIAAADTGADANGRPVQVFLTGAVVIAPNPTALAGGADGTAFVPGTYVKTAQTKMYAVSGSLMHFSGVAEPTHWTTDYTGAGFINMENQDGQSEQLVALERYFSRMAVFGRRSVQIWQIDVDPALNQQAQVLRNTGTIAARSVEQVGDNDVFYLSDTGVRSLRARDSSNSAVSNDIGAPIDDLVVQHVRQVGDAVAADAKAIVEPINGRYWLAIGDVIFTLSQFPGGKITAWSTQEPGFIPEDFIVIQNAVYVRAGDTIYLMGGSGPPMFDECLVEIELPLLDADKPAHFKQWTAIDLVVKGHWRIYAGFEPLNPTARELIAQIDAPTLSQQRIALNGYGTHASIKLENDTAEPAVVSNFILHYELADVG